MTQWKWWPNVYCGIVSPKLWVRLTNWKKVNIGKHTFYQTLM